MRKKQHKKGTMIILSTMFRMRKNGMFHSKDHSLNPGELGLLATLSVYDGTVRNETLPVGELAHRLQISQPAVTQLINRLEKRGLVERAASPEDRRSVLISMTPLGKELFAAACEDSLDLVDQVFDIMGKEKAEQFADLMNDFFLAMDQLRKDLHS